VVFNWIFESCLSLCDGQRHFLLWKMCDKKCGNIFLVSEDVQLRSEN
jgi:hypothetical protein